MPGKIQEIILVIVNACALSEKNPRIGLCICFQQKKNISITFTTHYRSFQSLKTWTFQHSHYAVVTHLYICRMKCRHCQFRLFSHRLRILFLSKNNWFTRKLICRNCISEAYITQLCKLLGRSLKLNWIIIDSDQRRSY